MDNNFKDQNNSEKHITTCYRSYCRNIPSQPLQPYLNARPVPTKYNFMPIIDNRKENEVPLIQQATYVQTDIFNPGNSKGPWSGYASNINNESELRNQIYALQRSSESVYIPSSKSNLYNVNWNNNNSNNSNQPHPGLFEIPDFFHLIPIQIQM